MIRRLRTDYVVSVLAHGLVLGASVISFAARPLDKPPSESIAVDIVSASELSQITDRKSVV